MSDAHHRTEDAITAAVDLIVANWAAMLDAGTPGEQVGSKPPPGSKPPVPIGTLHIRDEAWRDLRSWAQVIMEDRDLTLGPRTNDAPDLALFIARHAEWMSRHDAGVDCAEELGRHAAAVHHIAAPQPRDWMPLGDCTLRHDETGDACGGQVRARPNADDGYGETMARCKRCGTEAVASWWERTMYPDAETSRLVTADELVLVVHREFGKVVKPATIRQWIRRGWIEASGSDDKGRTLYDRGAVAYALTRRGVMERTA